MDVSIGSDPIHTLAGVVHEALVRYISAAGEQAGLAALEIEHPFTGGGGWD